MFPKIQKCSPRIIAVLVRILKSGVGSLRYKATRSIHSDIYVEINLNLDSSTQHSPPCVFTAMINYEEGDAEVVEMLESSVQGWCVRLFTHSFADSYGDFL